MGNYVFDADILVDMVREDADDDSSRHDMGGDIIRKLVDDGAAHVYDFTENEVPGQTERSAGYWRDVGTLDSYFAANMDLVDIEPVFSLYNAEWPIYTDMRCLPPAKMVGTSAHGAGTIANTIVSNGCILSGATVTGTVLAPDVRVEDGATLERSRGVHRCEDRAGCGGAQRHHRQERDRARRRQNRGRPGTRRGPVHHVRLRHRRRRQGPGDHRARVMFPSPCGGGVPP